MTLAVKRSSFESTSGVGAFWVRQLREPWIVGLIVVGLGTSTQALPSDQVSRPVREQQTSAGESVEVRDWGPASIAELRRLTGFTWEQLARLFNVSRRSVHFWASGNKMTAANEAHLQNVLRVVRCIDRGSAAHNRAALLAVREDGCTPFEELADGRYDVALELAGLGSPRTPMHSIALSASAKASRIPPSPEDLVAASPERVRHPPGKVRAGKSVRTESGA